MCGDEESRGAYGMQFSDFTEDDVGGEPLLFLDIFKES